MTVASKQLGERSNSTTKGIIMSKLSAPMIAALNVIGSGFGHTTDKDLSNHKITSSTIGALVKREFVQSVVVEQHTTVWLLTTSGITVASENGILTADDVRTWENISVADVESGMHLNNSISEMCKTIAKGNDTPTVPSLVLNMAEAAGFVTIGKGKDSALGLMLTYYGKSVADQDAIMSQDRDSDMIGKRVSSTFNGEQITGVVTGAHMSGEIHGFRLPLFSVHTDDDRDLVVFESDTTAAPESGSPGTNDKGEGEDTGDVFYVVQNRSERRRAGQRAVVPSHRRYIRAM